MLVPIFGQSINIYKAYSFYKKQMRRIWGSGGAIDIE